MKKFILLSLTLIPTCLWAQVKRESFDPKVTEVWEPAVKKVTPSVLTNDIPSDALSIFNGTDLNEWVSLDGSAVKWEVKNGYFTVAKGTGDIKTKRTFGDIQLHLEWRIPSGVKLEGQGGGNSGIFLQERYELQILDSYENQTYKNGQAGAIYKQTAPLVNACRKPGEWQVYDILYTAPRFNEKGELSIPAYITVLHNGIMIHNHTQIWGTTEYLGLPVYVAHGKASIKLQDHGDPISFRNIWIREF